MVAFDQYFENQESQEKNKSAESAEVVHAGGGSDREEVPLVQVDPEYPERARQQRIEGWVEVEFTISPVGTVVDARVSRSKPAMIFDRAALQAVRRWKYNPVIRDGTAIARPGKKTVFDFRLPNYVEISSVSFQFV